MRQQGSFAEGLPSLGKSTKTCAGKLLKTPGIASDGRSGRKRRRRRARRKKRKPHKEKSGAAPTSENAQPKPSGKGRRAARESVSSGNSPRELPSPVRRSESPVRTSVGSREETGSGIPSSLPREALDGDGSVVDGDESNVLGAVGQGAGSQPQGVADVEHTGEVSVSAPLLQISELPARGIELEGKIKHTCVRGYVDSGSSGNYIAEGLVNDLGLQTVPIDRTAVLADGKVIKITKACERIHIRFGQVTSTEAAFVFPELGYDLILGVPWLEKEDPRISFKDRTVSVQRKGQQIYLPIRTDYSTEQTVHSILNEIPITEIPARRVLKKVTTNDRSSFLVVVRDSTHAVPEGTERLNVVERGEAFNAPDDLEKLIRPDMPKAFQGVLEQHRGVFPKDLPKGLPPVRKGHEFRIDLEDEAMAPIHRPLYKLSPAELDEVKAQVDYLLDQKKIKPSDSPWGAPILFVPKKDGGLRMCVDYRWINKVTVKNRYPLPLPEELMDRVGKAKFFTKIDLRSGYWQFPVRPRDTAKTAFRTRYGHFEFLVAPFGLTNCPAQFQTLVQDILSDFLDVFVVVFIDDILVYSKDMEAHTEHVRQVLSRLKEHELYAKASKCEFAVSQTDYLGYHLTGEGVSPMEQKVQAIRDWKEPANVGDVRSFLGLASYYRKFIPQFSRVAGPLHDLTKKDFPWKWSIREQQAFNELKERLSNSPILLLPDPELPYTVITDASNDACGAVLMQDHGRGLQPISYLSRRFRAAELNYAPYDKELCAICYALVQWRHYLESCAGGCTVLTDHQPLTYIREQRNLSRTQARWLESGFFATIDPKIAYIRGKANVLADALSRSLPPSKAESAPGKVAAVSSWELSTPERTAWTRDLRADPKYGKIFEKLESGVPVPGYSLLNGLLVCIPPHSTEERVVVPKAQRFRIMSECHEVPYSGHAGLERTAHILKRRYWWAGWKAQLGQFIRECPVCQQIKADTRKSAGLLQPLPMPSAKWEQITTDLVTDLPTSTKDEYNAVAVFVDRLTKFVHFAPCKKTITAKEYAQLFIQHIFRHHGLPKVIISDRDPRFMSTFWQSLFKSLGTELRMSTAYHPQTDGQSEVTIRTLENFLRPYAERYPHRWAEYLPTAEFAANNAVSASTGYTPAYMMYGRHPTVPQVLDLSENKTEMVEQMVERMTEELDIAKGFFVRAQHRMCRAANKKRREVLFEPGDQVMVRSEFIPLASLAKLSPKLRRNFVGPFKVKKAISSVAYRLELPDHWLIHNVFHVSKLKRFHASAEIARQIAPPAGELVGGELEYEVERILRAKGPRNARKYLVLWTGYDLADASWEPEENLLPNARELLDDFLKEERRQRKEHRKTRRS